jgi:hypothetical protein
MVTTPSCVRLSTLSSILREEYRRRTAISGENPDPKTVKEAEAGIRRAHELLTAHREDCPMCVAYEREVALQCGARKPVNSERDFFRLDRVS